MSPVIRTALAFAVVWLPVVCLSAGVGTPVVAQGTFTVWQLPAQTHSQMMSYVIGAPDGRVMVIDGGMAGDAPYLRRFLKEMGGHVDAWFLTHMHDDHLGALEQILKSPDGLQIDKFYGSLPDVEWTAKCCDEGEIAFHRSFDATLRQSGRTVTDLRVGQVLRIGGVQVEVLGVRNPEFTVNALNNSSVVLRVCDSSKSVLFLGDLGPEGGEKLLHSSMAHMLPSDYVQMAHHGQNGVTKDFYQAVHARYALWPTPRWLWDNNSGKGMGSGPWRTLEVRQWMKDLGIHRNWVSADGLAQIR